MVGHLPNLAAGQACLMWQLVQCTSMHGRFDSKASCAEPTSPPPTGPWVVGPAAFCNPWKTAHPKWAHVWPHHHKWAPTAPCSAMPAHPQASTNMHHRQRATHLGRLGCTCAPMPPCTPLPVHAAPWACLGLGQGGGAWAQMPPAWHMPQQAQLHAPTVHAPLRGGLGGLVHKGSHQPTGNPTCVGLGPWAPPFAHMGAGHLLVLAHPWAAMAPLGAMWGTGGPHGHMCSHLLPFSQMLTPHVGCSKAQYA